MAGKLPLFTSVFAVYQKEINQLSIHTHAYIYIYKHLYSHLQMTMASDDSACCSFGTISGPLTFF